MLSVSYFCCCLLSIGYLLFSHDTCLQTELGIPTGLGILAGILLLFGFISLQVNIKINGVILSGLFAKLGVLVPVCLSFLFFNESLKGLQIIGFAAALFAIYLINTEDSSTCAVSSKWWLVLLLLANGFADFMSKVFDVYAQSNTQNYYLLISFFVAFVLSVLFALHEKQHLDQNDLFYGFLIGIPNFLSVKFLILSLERIPAVIAYPTYSVATILVISIVGTIVFHERLGKRQIIAEAIILLALVLLNIS